MTVWQPDMCRLNYKKGQSGYSGHMYSREGSGKDHIWGTTGIIMTWELKYINNENKPPENKLSIIICIICTWSRIQSPFC